MQMSTPQLHYELSHVRLDALHPVRAYSQYPHPDVAMHDHDFNELCVVVRGTAEHITPQGKETLSRGTIYILQPDSQHSLCHADGLELINVNYLAEWFLTDLRALRGIDHLLPLFFESHRYSRASVSPITRLDATPGEFETLMVELSDLILADASRRSLLYLESCFYKFLDGLALIYGRTFGRDLTSSVRQEVTRGLQAIETTVVQRGEFNAARVAREAGLSISRFETLFREHTGMSPIDYFQKHRVHHVCRRLLSSHGSIAEIAHEFGYADAAHLNRYFRRYLYSTPGEYRRRYSSS